MIYLVERRDTVTSKIDLWLSSDSCIPSSAAWGRNKLDPTKFEVADILAHSV
jgi:tRNA A37 threonylcarbamoyladenosine dehydratase